MFFSQILDYFAVSFFDAVKAEPLSLIFSAIILLVFTFNFIILVRCFRSSMNYLKSIVTVLKNCSGESQLSEKIYSQVTQTKLKDAVNTKKMKNEFSNQGLHGLYAKIENNLSFLQGGDKVYVSTELYKNLFTLEKITNKFFSRRISSASTVMTSLGIIGTFLGLTIGVASASSGLASPDIAIARESMSKLLDGAQIAFISSLTGISLAMIFKAIHTWVSEQIRRKLDELNDYFAACFNPRSNALGLLGHVQSTASSLKKIESTLVKIRVPEDLSGTLDNIGVYLETLAVSAAEFEKTKFSEAEKHQITKILMAILNSVKAQSKSEPRANSETLKTIN